MKEVAVAVQEAVQVGQRERSVPPQDGEGRRSQNAAAERRRSLGRRREGGDIDVGRAPTAGPRHRWVELVA